MSNERRICVDGTRNFRDLGGYLTSDGRYRTKWKQLFRSDHLGNVTCTEGNTSFLRDRLNIGCIIDLRTPGERQEQPYMIPGVLVYKVPIAACMPTVSKTQGATQLTEESAEAYMLHLYERFVGFKSEWKTFFRILVVQARKDYAVLFHCKTGRDRTGFSTALILLVLGVPLEVVYEDFLLSNEYFKSLSAEALKCMNVEKHAASAFCTVRRGYLERAIELICKQYGSFSNFVENEIGLTAKDIEILKQKFLEEA